MAFNYDRPIDRTHTSSMKWDLYAGRDILPMWVADMDFSASPEILKALHRRLDHGVLGYTNTPEALNEAVVRRMQVRHNWSIEPNWIVWLPGLVTALNLACRAVGESNDEVAVLTPIYPPFLSAPRLSDRQIKKIPLVEVKGRYVFDEDAFLAAISDRTRVLLLCSPHNPVGRAFTAEELRRIAELCVERDIVICSDEVHCDLILDDQQHIVTATLSEAIASRTITLMSPSKTFNLPGLNCAFAVIPEARLRQRFKRVRQGIVPHVGLFGYEGALAAYRYGEPWHRELLDYLRANRDCVQEAIGKMPALTMTHVEATYLAWIDARDLGVSDPYRFFVQAGVGLSDGRDFDGQGFVRLNFGCPRQTLTQALARMHRAVSQR